MLLSSSFSSKAGVIEFTDSSLIRPLSISFQHILVPVVNEHCNVFTVLFYWQQQGALCRLFLPRRLIQVAYVTSLACLCPKTASFEIFGCKYVCMYVISPHLPRSIQEENKRTLRTQIICDVENFKAGRNPVRKPRFFLVKLYEPVYKYSTRFHFIHSNARLLLTAWTRCQANNTLI